MKRARVLLADDHRIVAEGLKSLLEDDFDLAGIVSDGRTLVETAKQKAPDVIVSDISMPLLNGLDAARQLKREGVAAKIIFLTQHADAHLAAEAFRVGASGYLLKNSAGEELVTAISEVMRGRTYLTPLITQDVLSLLMNSSELDDALTVKLTSRQRQVLQLLAEGHSMKEVASVLNLSTKTVESHKYEMMKELDIKTNAELVQYAVKIRLVNPN